MDWMLGGIGRAIAQYLERAEEGYEPFTPSDPELLRANLQPGDVLLVEGNNNISGIIKYLTQSTWSHAALYVGPIGERTTTDGEPLVLVEANLGEGVVGAPLSIMLAQDSIRGNATVTICHVRTRDVAAHTRRADILVAAAGRPGLITADMVKPGAVVIDVGVHRTPDGLVGDVRFDEVSAVAGRITPVPGGVGPMTTAMLLVNTVSAAERASAATH